jgi:hypothetical protein
MGIRISEHVRGNIVGYIALFLVLTGGTAYALDGSNTVFSDDIVDGQVKAADLHTDAVGGAKVADGSLTGGDLSDRSIGGQKIGTETLSGGNVADGSLFGADIANDSLSAQDIGTHAIGSSELDPGAFASSDIAQVSASDPRYGIPANAIQGAEVSDDSLTGADVDESTLDTPEAAFAKVDGDVDLPSSGSRTVASRTIEPGSYVVLAKSSLSSNEGQFVTCRLNATRSGQSFDLDTATDPTVKRSFGLPGAWDEMSLMGFVGSSSANIELKLVCNGDGVTMSQTRLAAIKVNRLIGTNAP